MRALVLSAAAALLAIVADIGHTKTSATPAAHGITSRTASNDSVAVAVPGKQRSEFPDDGDRASIGRRAGLLEVSVP